MRHHRALFARVRNDTAAYVHPETFESVVDFVRGYDAACQGAVLAGFFEWLKLRGARGGNRGWWGLVEGLAFPEIFGGLDAERPAGLAAERRLIELFFDLMAEYDNVRERIGLKEIVRAYERHRSPQ